MKKRLDEISPKKIRENPENPRITFRQEEMESLLLSISELGIQVPLTVYKDGPAYRLIDGERRWRCATKLNMPSVPVIVQDRPSELANLLLMYNIHALREQWDYLTIASKLSRIEKLLEKSVGKKPTERELAARTGLTVGQIRRCRLLIGLPENEKLLLSEELEKPKAQQRLSEDFFIELQKSLRTVERRLPELGSELDEIRKVLIEKYTNENIESVTDFRLLARMSAAALQDEDAKKQVVQALKTVGSRSTKASIKDVYNRGFQFRFDEKSFRSHGRWAIEFLEEFLEDSEAKSLEDESIEIVRKLKSVTDRVLSD